MGERNRILELGVQAGAENPLVVRSAFAEDTDLPADTETEQIEIRKVGRVLDTMSASSASQ